MDKFSELKAAAVKAKELGGINNYAKGKAAVLAFQVAANPDIVLALLAELEAKDKRIAELEVIATDYAGKFQKAQDAAKHLVIMGDSDKAEIAHLKELLATPVRLPEHWDVSGQVNPPRIVQVQFEQQNRTLDQCADAVRLAGFTVEGDE